MSLDKITPYKNSNEDKKHQVARMFNNISGRYDFLNHLLSLGIDRGWRKKAISYLKNKKPLIILDIATGTADLAIAAIVLNPDKIYGVDISTEMLEIGNKKIQKKNLQDKIQLLENDSEQLIFEDNKFDAVTVGFGVRNFQNLRKGLSEIYRVLKPDGTLVILEFSQPQNPLIRRFYNFYSSNVTPRIGQIISRDRAAYSYLHESVKAFPYGNQFNDILKETGFKEIHHKPLTFGIATIYTAEK